MAYSGLEGFSSMFRSLRGETRGGELRDLVTISGASFRAPTIRSTAIMQRTMCHRKAIPLRAEGSQKKRWEVGRREGTHRICSMHIVSSPDPLTIDTSAS
jgi:hypothetical protein